MSAGVGVPDLFALPWWAYAWIVVVTLIASYTQGVMGFGYPIVGTPLLTLLIDLRVAIFVMLIPIVVVCFSTMLRGGGFLRTLREYWYLPLVIALGSYAGTRLFFAVDPAPLLALLAALLMLYLALDHLGIEVKAIRNHPQWFGAGFGLAAGVTESLVNVAAPMLLVYLALAGLAPSAMVQTLNLCFFVGKSTQTLSWMQFSGIPASAWVATLPLALLAWSMATLGAKRRERAPVAQYRMWLRRFVALMVMLLLWQFAYKMWG
jgi:uncharacterized protein